MCVTWRSMLIPFGPTNFFFNPCPSPSLSFFSLDYCSSFLTGTMPLFSPSPSLFFTLCQSTSLKYKSVHFIPLLKILQWFSVAHKMKFKLLIMAHPSSGSCLHFQQHFLLLSLPRSAFQQHWTIYGYWNLIQSSQAFAFGTFPSLKLSYLLVFLVNPCYLS